MFEKVKSRVKSLLDEKYRRRRNIALFVDGPNMLRSEFEVDLEDITKKLSEYGEIKIAKVFLNQFAPSRLLEAITNIGFEPIVSTVDADVPLTISAMETLQNPVIDTIALMTRDSDFQPLLTKAKENGRETILITIKESLSVALKNTADHIIYVSVKKK